MLPLIAAGIGAGVGLGESIWGGIKASKANSELDELEKNRPQYSRPDEIKQYLEMAKTGYNSKMPGTTQIEQNTQQATQGALSNLEDTGRLDAGSIQKLYQSELGAYNNLAMQQAQYHQSQQSQLAQALSESAKYSDQEFEYNINAPWQRKMNRAANKYEAGQSMIGKGISGITGSAYAYLGMGNKGKTASTGYENLASYEDKPDFNQMTA